MAALCWMAVRLALLLSAGNSLDNVVQQQLPRIVNEILTRYTRGSQLPMFSLAVSVPFNSKSNMYDVSQVTDRDDDVRSALLNCEVHTGQMVVAATVLKFSDVFTKCLNRRVKSLNVLTKCPEGVVTWADVQKRCPEAVPNRNADHAEYRTLEHLNTLNTEHNKQGLLVFYVFASPCPGRCTKNPRHNQGSILGLINPITQWTNYAVVFSEALDPPNDPIDVKDLEEALKQLGGYHPPNQLPIGLNNIFRCDRDNNNVMQCMSCSTTDGNVTPQCVSNTLLPDPSHTNLPSASGSRAGGGGGRG